MVSSLDVEKIQKSSINGVGVVKKQDKGGHTGRVDILILDNLSTYEVSFLSIS